MSGTGNSFRNCNLVRKGRDISPFLPIWSLPAEFLVFPHRCVWGGNRVLQKRLLQAEPFTSVKGTLGDF